jgi:hypothetical protein
MFVVPQSNSEWWEHEEGEDHEECTDGGENGFEIHEDVMGFWGCGKGEAGVFDGVIFWREGINLGVVILWDAEYKNRIEKGRYQV